MNRIHNMSVEKRAPAWPGLSEGVRQIDGSFALVAREGKPAPRAFARPAALLLGQAQRGAGVGVGPDRRDPRLSRERGPRRPVSSELRAWCRRMSSRSASGLPRPDAGYTRFFTPARARAAEPRRSTAVRRPWPEIGQRFESVPETGFHRRCFRRRGQRGGLLVTYHLSKARRQSGRLKAFMCRSRRSRSRSGAAFSRGA